MHQEVLARLDEIKSTSETKKDSIVKKEKYPSIVHHQRTT